MASNVKNTMTDNPTSRGQMNEDQNTSSANAQDQTLLKALQDLIVRVMDPKQTNDMNPMHLGPEAGKLISALQEFISSIVVQSQSGPQIRVIDVSMDKEEELLRSDFEENDHQRGESDSDDEEDEPPSESGSPVDNVSYELGGDVIKNNNSGAAVTLEKLQPTFEENLLRALREHVFNKMPIRLLCFEPHRSSFRITLFERGAIFARLASDLRGKMYKKEFRPRRWKLFDGEREIAALGVEKDTIERLVSKYARYAILSHTWLRTASGEVTYGDWNKGLVDAKDPGYQKMVNFCKAAWKDHRLALGWMDTVCINKESSSELDESIRSMYNWYERAAVCITYLAETQTLANMHLDPWFTRGWTLQELVAPEFIKFYNSDWKGLIDHSASDKNDTDIAKQIKRATTITGNELYYIRKAPISRKMQLAATREVTREEDTAYSLMGIFNVSIPTAYGEGAERAFLRLLQEIMASSDGALDLLNWAGDFPSPPPSTSRILPSSPKHYINRSSNINLQLLTPIEPLTLSVLGLCVPVILMPGIHTKLQSKPIGDYKATVDISSTWPLPFHDSTPITYNLLDKKIYSYGLNVVGEPHMTFAVFNFSTERNIVYVPKRCIALGLMCSEPAGDVSNRKFIDTIRTEKPIVFELSNRNTKRVDPNIWYWQIQRCKLPKHGIQLISLYL